MILFFFLSSRGVIKASISFKLAGNIRRVLSGAFNVACQFNTVSRAYPVASGLPPSTDGGCLIGVQVSMDSTINSQIGPFSNNFT